MDKEIKSVAAQAGALAALNYTPLLSTLGTIHIVSIQFSTANGSATTNWVQGIHYTVNAKVITSTSVGVAAGAGSAEITYTHSGY